MVNTCTYTTSFADKSDTDGESFITTLFGFYVCDYFFEIYSFEFSKWLIYLKINAAK